MPITWYQSPAVTRSTNHPQCSPKHPQLTSFANTPHPPVAPPTITYTHYTDDNAAVYTSDKGVLSSNTSFGHCCISHVTSNQRPTATISNPQILQELLASPNTNFFSNSFLYDKHCHNKARSTDQNPVFRPGYLEKTYHLHMKSD